MNDRANWVPCVRGNDPLFLEEDFFFNEDPFFKFSFGIFEDDEDDDVDDDDKMEEAVEEGGSE